MLAGISKEIGEQETRTATLNFLILNNFWSIESFLDRASVPFPTVPVGGEYRQPCPILSGKKKKKRLLDTAEDFVKTDNSSSIGVVDLDEYLIDLFSRRSIVVS